MEIEGRVVHYFKDMLMWGRKQGILWFRECIIACKYIIIVPYIKSYRYLLTAMWSGDGESFYLAIWGFKKVFW